MVLGSESKNSQNILLPPRKVRGQERGSQGPRYLAAFSLDFSLLLCMTSQVSFHQLSTVRRRLVRRSGRLPVHTPVSPHWTPLCSSLGHSPGGPWPAAEASALVEPTGGGESGHENASITSEVKHREIAWNTHKNTLEYNSTLNPSR